MIHHIIFLRLLPIIFLITTFSSPSFAQSDFNVSFDTTYTLDSTGIIQVDQIINLTNKHANIYATQYSLNLGPTRIKDLSVINQSGQSIPHQIDQQESNTNIFIQFDDKIVGRGQTLTFTIKYLALDIAQKSGQVLEVNIPKLSDTESINQAKVKLRVPIEYGQPSIISPNDFQLTQDPAYSQLEFSDSSIRQTSISAIFGDKQHYQFEISYHLDNPTITPIETQIALPPDTSYQKVYLNHIDPPPLRLDTDQDSNWIASYSLQAKEDLTIKVSGIITVHNQPTYQLSSDTNYTNYLQQLPFWPVNDPQITDFSKNLKTPEQIYQYIVENFNYAYERIDNLSTSRHGGLHALNNSHDNLCLEFSDAFITLARAAGIPARLNTGFAYTQNEHLKPLGMKVDLLHAWPEYYDNDKKLWISIDPTWAVTTQGQEYFHHFDFNHVVFAKHGVSSEHPLPAGYYQSTDPNQQINITITDKIPQINIDIAGTITSSQLALLGLSNSHTLDLTNNSNIAIYNQSFNLSGNNIHLISQPQHSFKTFLPFSQIKVPLKFKPIKNQQPNSINLKLGDYQQSYEISPLKATNIYFIIIILASTMAIIIGSNAIKSGGLLVSKQKNNTKAIRPKLSHKPIIQDNYQVLYIGKAKNLKSRISSYKRTNQLLPKTKQLVKFTSHINFITTDTELDAILLEADLISTYQPPYNIRLKDDKSPIYIAITNELFPKILATRKQKLTSHSNVTRLFGPFSSSNQVRRLLKIARRIFPYCNAQRSKKIRPCFYHHIDLCPGVCTHQITSSEYQQNIRNLTLFFSGKKHRLKRILNNQINIHIKLQQFESAQTTKLQLQAYEHIINNYRDFKSYQPIPNLDQDITNHQLIDLKRLLSKHINLPNDYHLTRIEGYDASNLQGQHPTASMVVFTHGKPDKSEYRHFNIKSISIPNDIQMIKQTLSRRINRNDWPIPNLIVIDGGKGHLKTARLTIPWSIPVISIAKNPDRLMILIKPPPKPSYHIIKLNLKNPSSKLLTQIRNESHRFSKRLHSKQTLKFIGPTNHKNP